MQARWFLGAALVVVTTLSGCVESWVCDPTSCADGCCQEDGVCRVGDPHQCGSGGGACAVCATGESCQGSCCLLFNMSCTRGGTGCCSPRTCHVISGDTGTCQ
jgi:hypothetical protein